MNLIVRLIGGGGLLSGLADQLRAASLTVEGSQGMQAATVLVTHAVTAEAAIAGATAFAAADGGGCGRLIVHIWQAPPSADWIAMREAAIMAAFTRHAAGLWAARRVRVNALALGASAAHDDAALLADVATTVLALLRWPSMTGQLIRLARA